MVYADARRGQADVKRGQLRARPLENVAFCWIRPRDFRPLSVTNPAWTCAIREERTELMRPCFAGSSKGRRCGRAFTWSRFYLRRATVTHIDVSKLPWNARGRS